METNKSETSKDRLLMKSKLFYVSGEVGKEQKSIQPSIIRGK